MANFSDPPPILSDALLTPSARTSPMPSLLPIFSTIRTTASGFPKLRSMPSVSLSVMIPLSKHSIANPITQPAEIVSSPSSSHSRFALATDSRTSLPHCEPSAYMVSNSGPSKIVPAYGPLFILVIFPHPTGQVRQALSLTTNSFRILSPLIRSAPSNTPSVKFLVGRTPKWSMMRIMKGVPSLGMVSPVAEFSLSFLVISPENSIRPSMSATSTPSCPLTATAFKNLLPITAPMPVLPACLPKSEVIHAYLTRFSPASPMLAILAFSSVSPFKISSVWCVVFPHRCPALLSSAPPSRIQR